jgi:acetyl esterase/lipase
MALKKRWVILRPATRRATSYTGPSMRNPNRIRNLLNSIFISRTSVEGNGSSCTSMVAVGRGVTNRRSMRIRDCWSFFFATSAWSQARPIQTNEARKVTYADQANDIAAALKWLSNHVEEFGGRPEGFILLGYSSGAHLSALVALDNRYLSNQGLDGSWVKGVISVDVHSYDIPAALIEMEQSPLKKNISLMTSLFGGSRSEQNAASPIAYLANPAPKSFLLFSCGRSGGRPQTVSKVMSKSFKESLIAHGHTAVHVHLGHCDHRSILSRFGSPRDRVSKNIKDFLVEISEERQREAVRLAETTNRPAVEIAREFGVSFPEFYSWRNRHRSTSDSPASGKGSVRRGPGNIAPRVQNSIEEISEERQREAVRLAETTNRSAVEIAREFGVPLHEFYAWRKHFKQHRSTRTSASYSGGTTQVRSRTDSPA